MKHKNRIYLETKRLILRDYTRADLEAYYKLKSDDKDRKSVV